MKLICSFAWIALLTAAIRPSAIAQEPPFVDGELIVQFIPGVDVGDFVKKYDWMGVAAQEELWTELRVWLLTYDTKRVSSGEALDAIKRDEKVSFAQFNHDVSQRTRTPNDPRFGEQWALNNTGQGGGTPDADIDAPEAWDIATGGSTVQGDQIVVAVIDGGFDLSHVDLSFFKNTHEIPGNGIDDDGNGYIDDYDGWNAYNMNGTIPVDLHGTHVAGIAAARGNNGVGVSGVNWGAKVMPIAGASGTEAVVVRAYRYAWKMRQLYNQTSGAQGAFVVVTNSSFGIDGGQCSSFPLWNGMYDEMGSVGILSCAATANQNWNIDVVGDVPTGCPSNYLISVTNTTNTDAKNSGAAYGLTTIDLGAPGTGVLSTVPGNSYTTLTGTSMASPTVAGVVALMFAAADAGTISAYKSDPANKALLFKGWLLAGVDPIPALNGITVTGGRLNARGALDHIPPSNHLSSTSLNALANCSQRKIIRDWGGVLYACYESGGHILVMSSNNNGTTWSSEVDISGNPLPGYSHRFPCVSRNYLAIDNKVLVAWEESGRSGANYVNRVRLRSIGLDLNAATIQDVTTIQLQMSYSFSTSPVLAPSFGYSTLPTLLAWYDPSVAGIRGYVVTYASSALLFQGNVAGPFTMSANDYSGISWLYPTWDFAWSSGGAVYRGYCELHGSTLVSYGSTIFDPSHSTGVHELCMVRIGDSYGVSWIDDGIQFGPIAPSSYSVHFKQYYSGPVTIWPDAWGSVSSPSLTYNYTSGKIGLFWQGGTYIRNAICTGGTWSPIGAVIPGATPSISVGAPGDRGPTTEVLLSRGLSGPPYAIQSTQIAFGAEGEGMSPGPKGDGGRPDADQEITTVEGRGGYIVFPKGSMHVVLLSALANGQALSYPALSNTLHVERSEQIESGVTTLPAVGVGTLDLKVRYTGTGIIPAGHFSIDVKDANSGVLLQRVKTVGDVGDTLMALHVPLNYPGREVTVGLTLSNMEAATGLTLERWYLPWEGGPSQLTGLPIARQSELPTSIALHQNYPNPFNPTTEIRFDLPDAGNVSLVVYDVLGRKVAELANGYQAAGYHAATWNAAGAASGVYFARFSVTSAEGAVAYTKINKLVLMK